MPTMAVISLTKLIVGGAPMFPNPIKNQKRVNLGSRFKTPELRLKSRAPDRRYKVLAPAKRAEEHTPWLSIIIVAPKNPQVEPLR